jgi:putative mycofactocin binding protein MftB
MSSVIKLSKGMHVRREEFGLIFYNVEKEDLTLVKSGDILEPHFLEGSYSKEVLIANQPEAKKKRILELLCLLERKGFICEQTVG